ncbi:MAG: hypothetical protein ABJB22_06295 [Verrucomicrobiota bacterium]
MNLSQQNPERATSLIEATMAVGISAMFLGSLFSMNSSSMRTIQMARESACASQVLQQRVESLRIANWHQITDADWLKANILNADAAGSGGLKAESETLTLVPYGSLTPGNTQLSRSRGSPTIIVNRSTALLAENAIKVIWKVNYTGAPNDRPISRQTVAILAKGGVAKW